MKKNYPIKEQKKGSGASDGVSSGVAEAELERMMPFFDGASRLTVICRREDYSASRIASAIEDCDAHVLNLNLTSDIVGDGEVVVDVRVDRVNVASMARSLERYGYSVVGIDRPDNDFDEESRRRVEEFLRYLDV